MLIPRLSAAFIVLASISIRSEAQLLPDVNVPTLPAVSGSVNDTVRGVGDTLASADLRELRAIQVRSLLRRHRDVLERSPSGDPIVRRELLTVDPSATLLERAQAEGFTIGRDHVLQDLGIRIVVLLAPPGVSTRRALRRLQTFDPDVTIDFNHVYLGSATANGSSVHSLQNASNGAEPSRGALRIGLIDTGVHQTHPAFATTAFRAHGCEGAAMPAAHGTAVASLMAMQAGAALELFTADVYCNEPVGGSVSRIAEAFAWMARERVAVINVSLVGPPNRTLEHIVRAVLKRGHIIVAAVGNDGPNAKPLYPAAYDGVIGVTGIDRKDRVIIEALRGPQVDFAAAGADITAATLDNQYGSVRGTSFAAPIVAALVALDHRELAEEGASAVVSRLAKQARDLGSPGLDPTYGYGAVAGRVSGQAHRRE